MLRRRGTYTVNADAEIRNAHTKAAELITIATNEFGMFLSVNIKQQYLIFSTNFTRQKYKKKNQFTAYTFTFILMK